MEGKSSRSILLMLFYSSEFEIENERMMNRVKERQSGRQADEGRVTKPEKGDEDTPPLLPPFPWGAAASCTISNPGLRHERPGRIDRIVLNTIALSGSPSLCCDDSSRLGGSRNDRMRTWHAIGKITQDIRLMDKRRNRYGIVWATRYFFVHGEAKPLCWRLGGDVWCWRVRDARCVLIGWWPLENHRGQDFESTVWLDVNPKRRYEEN